MSYKREKKKFAHIRLRPLAPTLHIHLICRYYLLTPSQNRPRGEIPPARPLDPVDNDVPTTVKPEDKQGRNEAGPQYGVRVASTYCPYGTCPSGQVKHKTSSWCVPPPGTPGTVEEDVSLYECYPGSYCPPGHHCPEGFDLVKSGIDGFCFHKTPQGPFQAPDFVGSSNAEQLKAAHAETKKLLTAAGLRLL